MARSVSPIEKLTITGCVYEVVALTTGKVPTITRLVRIIGRHRAGRALAWLWVGYVAGHFLSEDS